MQKLFNFDLRNSGLLMIAVVLSIWLVFVGAPSFPQNWLPLSAQQEITPLMAANAAKASRKSAISTYLAAQYRVPLETVKTYVELAWTEADKHENVTPELILAVIQKESSLRYHAQSGYGAQGLMQVVRRWHTDKIEDDESLLEARVNIRVGAEILQEYIDKKGNLRDALIKYSGNAKGYADFVLHKAKELQMI